MYIYIYIFIYTHICTYTYALVVPFQQLLEGPMEVLLCEPVMT